MPSPFLTTVCEVEERLFANLLDPEDTTRMKNYGEYSWLYRPSHHIRTGLITEQDIVELQHGKRLLSIGAYPAFLERVLRELGAPAEAITVTDVLPEICQCEGDMKKHSFDATDVWPGLGQFQLIIFPESLCIVIRDRIKRDGEIKNDDPFPTDTREAELLAHVLKEALSRLTAEGEIRANGPMSHPKVVKAASELLNSSGCSHSLEYERFFLTVRRSKNWE